MRKKSGTTSAVKDKTTNKTKLNHPVGEKVGKISGKPVIHDPDDTVSSVFPAAALV